MLLFGSRGGKRWQRQPAGQPAEPWQTKELCCVEASAKLAARARPEPSTDLHRIVNLHMRARRHQRHPRSGPFLKQGQLAASTRSRSLARACTCAHINSSCPIVSPNPAAPDSAASPHALWHPKCRSGTSHAMSHARRSPPATGAQACCTTGHCVRVGALEARRAFAPPPALASHT